MNRTIQHSKERIRLFIADQKDDELTHYQRLLSLEEASFFCYLAAINISTCYKLTINNWLFIDFIDTKEQEASLNFSTDLLFELLPLMKKQDISILPRVNNFVHLLYYMSESQPWKNAEEFLKMKSMHTDIQNYLDFLIFTAEPYDAFILNIQFRTEIVMHHQTLLKEISEEYERDYANLYRLILLMIVFDFHHDIFDDNFSQSKDKSMDLRAEQLFTPFETILK